MFEYTLKISPNFTISVISERILRNMQRLISEAFQGSLRHLLWTSLQISCSGIFKDAIQFFNFINDMFLEH